jgi:hypothetical protein
LLVYREIRHGPFEAGVLSFEFLKALGLVDPHTAVFFAPAVESLLGDAQPLDHLSDGLALALQDFSFPQFADNRFGVYRFSAMIQLSCQLKILT